jgi:hypothetical protein
LFLLTTPKFSGPVPLLLSLVFYRKEEITPLIEKLPEDPFGLLVEVPYDPVMPERLLYNITVNFPSTEGLSTVQCPQNEFYKKGWFGKLLPKEFLSLTMLLGKHGMEPLPVSGTGSVKVNYSNILVCIIRVFAWLHDIFYVQSKSKVQLLSYSLLNFYNCFVCLCFACACFALCLNTPY